MILKRRKEPQSTQGDQRRAARTEKCLRLSEFVKWDHLVSLEASRRSSSAAKTWRSGNARVRYPKLCPKTFLRGVMFYPSFCSNVISG